LRVDNINLQIVILLARDSRTPYNNIASVVGITPSAAKKRVSDFDIRYLRIKNL
jgi:DNA-binding Lrp family transcriptional regulator